METELVSVMMPAFNAGRYIGQAIASFLSQRYHRAELVIVNDGSVDDTGSIARSFGKPEIRALDQSNGGEAAARNTALKHMRGEFVAFLDADDQYLPDHLEAATTFLLRNPAFAATYSDGYYCDAEGSLIRTLASRRPAPVEGDIFEHVVRTSSTLGPPVCVVLRRSLIEKHYLRFDEAITIGPDWDFLTRYAEVGRFKYIDRKTCHYRLHDNNISTSVAMASRAADLARCRKKAIKLARFSDCSAAARVEVFYDLLVNLLLGRGDEQAEITCWAEFRDLPAPEQGLLLRLMASKALAHVGDSGYVAEWLSQARKLRPFCVRGKAIAALYAVSPALCRQALRLRLRSQGDPRQTHPFADLEAPTGPSKPRKSGRETVSRPLAAKAGRAIGAGIGAQE